MKIQIFFLLSIMISSTITQTSSTSPTSSPTSSTKSPVKKPSGTSTSPSSSPSASKSPSSSPKSCVVDRCVFCKTSTTQECLACKTGYYLKTYTSDKGKKYHDCWNLNLLWFGVLATMFIYLIGLASCYLCYHWGKTHGLEDARGYPKNGVENHEVRYHQISDPEPEKIQYTGHLREPVALPRVIRADPGRRAPQIVRRGNEMVRYSQEEIRPRNTQYVPSTQYPESDRLGPKPKTRYAESRIPF